MPLTGMGRELQMLISNSSPHYAKMLLMKILLPLLKVIKKQLVNDQTY